MLCSNSIKIIFNLIIAGRMHRAPWGTTLAKSPKPCPWGRVSHLARQGKSDPLGHGRGVIFDITAGKEPILFITMPTMPNRLKTRPVTGCELHKGTLGKLAILNYTPVINLLKRHLNGNGGSYNWIPQIKLMVISLITLKQGFCTLLCVALVHGGLLWTLSTMSLLLVHKSVRGALTRKLSRPLHSKVCCTLYPPRLLCQPFGALHSPQRGT